MWKEKKVMLDEKMGKVAKDERKKKKRKEKKREEKCSIVFIVLKILCWWSFKSKEVKYWCLKIENLLALMEYLVWKIFVFLEMLYFFWF